MSSASETGSENEVSFAELGVAPAVTRALTDIGYESASPIQAATIPALLAGRHVVGLAQTGTGKTAAFAVPILSKIDPTSTATQALILAPTRELALQVSEAMIRYAHHLPDVTVLAIYGGQSYGVQLAGLRRGAQVVVGTPGRIIDHLSRKTLDLSQLRFLVLDEADEMLQMGFQEDVETILASTPEQKQVALFSATMPAQIRRISQQYLTDAAEITVASKTMTAANTRQRYIVVPNARKLDALTRVLEVEPFAAMIIFVRTKQATEELAERLRARGFSAAAINGDLVQAQRERAVNQLRQGDLDILVATDVAARGLDVERISHVLNYDIPTDSEAYVHRIGRTGRAGRSGEAITFVTPREKHQLTSIERATRQPVTATALPSVDDVNSSRMSKFDEAITVSLQSEELATFRDLISHYQREHNVDVADIAAALAVLWRDDEEFLMTPDREPAPQFDSPRSQRPARREAATSERPHTQRRERGERRREDLATYRISVGKRHKVSPGAIVGAIANEGGLGRADFGRIDIRGDHTLVELPASLSPAALQRLQGTRISGQLIHLEQAWGGELRAAGGQRDGQRDHDSSQAGSHRGGHRGAHGGSHGSPRSANSGGTGGGSAVRTGKWKGYKGSETTGGQAPTREGTHRSGKPKRPR